MAHLLLSLSIDTTHFEGMKGQLKDLHEQGTVDLHVTGASNPFKEA